MVRDRRPGEVCNSSSSDDESLAGRGRGGLDRRTLLRTVPVVGAVGLAGCASVEDALGEYLGDGGSDGDGHDGGAEAATTLGYGGTTTTVATTIAATTETSTPTDIATATPTDTATATSTRTQTTSATQTSTDTATETTTTPEDDYAEQGYGQYGYGGIR